MRAFSIGVVGAGRMGHLHARNAAANPRFNLVAIADHSREAAETLARDVGAEVATYEQILAGDAVDAVVVASSTSSHLDNVRAALAAGKAVFCEKPLSLDSEALARVLPEIEAAGAPQVQVAFNRRFDPNLKALKRRVDEGEIGRIESLHIVNHDPAPPPPDFIPRSGGLFRDFTIHDFDTASWLLGEPIVELFASGACLVDPAIAAQGDIDTAKLVLRTASGALCLVSNSRRSGYGYDQRVEAFGAKGRLSVENLSVNSSAIATEAGIRDAPFFYSFAERYAEAYRAELDHFADVLESGVTPATGPRDSLRALRLADAAAESLDTGSPVQIKRAEVR